MHIASMGIDLGKNTFHLVALGERSKVLVRKKFSRTQLLAHTVSLAPSLIGLEACSGAHFPGAALREQGHEARLIPAPFVKPYRKSNKNGFLDAEAIAEAVTKQNMRLVPIKSEAQLDVQAMHRVRDRLVQRRTALINEIRGFLLERGITFPARPIHLRKNLPTVVEDAEQNLIPRLRWLLDRLWQEWKQTEIDIEKVTDEMERMGTEDERWRRLRQIPGFGLRSGCGGSRSRPASAARRVSSDRPLLRACWPRNPDSPEQPIRWCPRRIHRRERRAHRTSRIYRPQTSSSFIEPNGRLTGKQEVNRRN